VQQEQVYFYWQSVDKIITDFAKSVFNRFFWTVNVMLAVLLADFNRIFRPIDINYIKFVFYQQNLLI